MTEDVQDANGSKCKTEIHRTAENSENLKNKKSTFGDVNKYNMSSENNTDVINSVADGVISKKKKKKIKNRKSKGILDTGSDLKSKLDVSLTKDKLNSEEVEDAAESVDSGCIADSSSDTPVDVTDWHQVRQALESEYRFITNLLIGFPVHCPEPEIEHKHVGSKKRKNDDRTDSGNPEHVKDDEPPPTKLEALHERYLARLEELKVCKKKRIHMDPGLRKKESKLNMKLTVLAKRRKKEKKRQLRQFENEEMGNLKGKMAASKGYQKQIASAGQKRIYNQKGELVFSKFDFSNAVPQDIDPSRKSKDLKQVLSQALKEKEKIKKLESIGEVETAAKIQQEKAWSSALQKAEGKKVLEEDVITLKNVIKRKESHKKVSQKKWKQRQETLEKNMASRQAKRNKNIKTKKDTKILKKMSKMKKKGHVVPGF